MLQATAAESHSMRSSAVAAGAVPLLSNVLKDGALKDPQPEMGYLFFRMAKLHIYKINAILGDMRYSPCT